MDSYISCNPTDLRFEDLFEVHEVLYPFQNLKWIFSEVFEVAELVLLSLFQKFYNWDFFPPPFFLFFFFFGCVSSFFSFFILIYLDYYYNLIILCYPELHSLALVEVSFTSMSCCPEFFWEFCQYEFLCIEFFGLIRHDEFDTVFFGLVRCEELHAVFFGLSGNGSVWKVYSTEIGAVSWFSFNHQRISFVFRINVSRHQQVPTPRAHYNVPALANQACTTAPSKEAGQPTSRQLAAPCPSPYFALWPFRACCCSLSSLSAHCLCVLLPCCLFTP